MLTEPISEGFNLREAVSILREIDRNMRLIITGATGAIGKLLVPFLRERGHDLLLVGRSVEPIKALFGNDTLACDYASLSANAQGFDAVIHMAVLNNSSDVTDQKQFQAANVELLDGVAQASVSAGITRFINLSSLRADPESTDPYSSSKGLGEVRLKTIPGLHVINLKLAAVYGEGISNKLAILGRMPRFLERTLLSFLTCLKPAVDAQNVLEQIESAAEGPQSSPWTDRYVTNDQSENLVYRVLSRIIDLTFAIGIIVFFWWLLGVIWLIVRLTSEGSGIFAQARIGREEVPFTCYKFRTMAKNTKQLGTHEIGASAITPIGHFLRKTKLDEFPQVINILFNQMSLIGPRPNLPNQTELRVERRKRGVYAVKPGITGLAQIRGVDMSQPKMLSEIDARYIATRTLLLDLKITLATFTGSGQGDKVRQDAP